MGRAVVWKENGASGASVGNPVAILLSLRNSQSGNDA